MNRNDVLEIIGRHRAELTTDRRGRPLGPAAYVFGGESGEFQESFKTAWETMLILANGYDSKRTAR
jgi:hypothetical protein